MRRLRSGRRTRARHAIQKFAQLLAGMAQRGYAILVRNAIGLLRNFGFGRRRQFHVSQLMIGQKILQGSGNGPGANQMWGRDQKQNDQHPMSDE